MRIIIRNARSAFALCALSIALAACSGGGDSATEVVVDPNATPCGPTQEMAGYSAYWIYYQCAETDSVIITVETQDPRSGLPLGDTAVNRGMLSFRYHYLDNADFGDDITFGAYFEAGGVAHDWEANWQFLSFWYAPKNVLFSLLKVQRFDGTCSPYCQKIVESDKLQFTNTADVYQWDCEWDGTKDKVQCAVTKIGDPNFYVNIKNQTFGVYNTLKTLRLGRQASKNYIYGSYQGSVSDVKLTIFN